MNGKKYLVNKLSVILINLLGMLFLAVFLLVSGSEGHSILFILFVWILVLS